MKLEVGKYYKTRDGRKVGPMYLDDNLYWEVGGKNLDGMTGIWLSSGKADFFTYEEPSHRIYDLIAEWTEEPAQLTAIDHLRKAAELFLADGNDKAAFDVLGVVLDHE